MSEKQITLTVTTSPRTGVTMELLDDATSVTGLVTDRNTVVVYEQNGGSILMEEVSSFREQGTAIGFAVLRTIGEAERYQESTQAIQREELMRARDMEEAGQLEAKSMSKKTKMQAVTITINLDGDNVAGISTTNMEALTSAMAREKLQPYIEDLISLTLRREGVRIMKEKREQYMKDLAGMEKDFAAYSKGELPEFRQVQNQFADVPF